MVIPTASCCAHGRGLNQKASLPSQEKAAKWQQAVAVLYEMLAPNIFSFNAAISACEKAAKWQMALGLLETLPELRLKADVITVNAVLSSCEKAPGEWQQALWLLKEVMRQWQLQADQISYSSAISCCEKAGQWQQALNLLAGYKRSWARPRLQNWLLLGIWAVLGFCACWRCVTVVVMLVVMAHHDGESVRGHAR